LNCLIGKNLKCQVIKRFFYAVVINNEAGDLTDEVVGVFNNKEDIDFKKLSSRNRNIWCGNYEVVPFNISCHSNVDGSNYFVTSLLTEKDLKRLKVISELTPEQREALDL
jgi:hypothetical protein